MHASPFNAHFDQLNPFGSQMINSKELIERFFASAVSQDQFNITIDGGGRTYEVLMQIHTMQYVNAFNPMPSRNTPQPEFVKFTVYADPQKIENIELVMACVFANYVAMRPEPENNLWGSYQVNSSRKGLNLLAIRNVGESGVPGEPLITTPMPQLTIKSASVEVVFGMPVMIPSFNRGHGPEAGLSAFNVNQQPGPGWTFTQNHGVVGFVTPPATQPIMGQTTQDVSQDSAPWPTLPSRPLTWEEMLKDPRTGELPSGLHSKRSNKDFTPPNGSTQA